MISTIGRAATILALCFSLGGQWLALQSVAWTTMLVENACHEPLAVAVAKTFDGAHPCALCHAVAAGKKSEKKSEAFPAASKLDLACATYQLPYRPSFAAYAYPAISFAVPERVQAPPAPPPRALRA